VHCSSTPHSAAITKVTSFTPSLSSSIWTDKTWKDARFEKKGARHAEPPHVPNI